MSFLLTGTFLSAHNPPSPGQIVFYCPGMGATPDSMPSVDFITTLGAHPPEHQYRVYKVPELQ